MGTTKDKLIEELRQAREGLLDSVKPLSEPETSVRDSIGVWSIKDVLAHMIFWDEELLKGMKSLLEGGRPDFLDRDWDELNRREVEKRKGQSLQELFLGLDRSGSEVLQFLAELDETELSRTRGVKWKTWDVTIEWFISGNIEHDRHHTSRIHAWRRKKVD